jgi:hypothetical protein
MKRKRGRKKETDIYKQINKKTRKEQVQVYKETQK